MEDICPSPLPEAICPRVALEGIDARLSWQGQLLPGKVLNLSSTGAFFATQSPLDLHDAHDGEAETAELLFDFRGESFRITVSPRWHNRVESARQPAGYGLQFRNVDLRLLKCLLRLSENRAA